MHYSQYQSPVGQLLLVGDNDAIHKIEFPNDRKPVEPCVEWEKSDLMFSTLSHELDAYFEGSLQHFSVALSPEGTEFQRNVWNALLDIEYGETCNYRDIASAIGKPTASRAVGSANGANPIPIVIPCHRVIGANGTLTGFSGGLHTKHWLLTHEAGEQSLFPFEEW